MHHTATHDILRATAAIPAHNFRSYGSGWPNQVSMALIDAIYSIGTRYTTAHGRGK